MPTCVIFNPTAKGNKARHFHHHLDAIGEEAVLKETRSASDARRLAAEAVRDQFEIIVAAGGDGTVNEVLNGIGDVPDGFDRTRLGVLPLGTVNVLARELGIPIKLKPAWEIIRAAKELRIDLPLVKFGAPQERRYFAQLAGAGVDARAIELVSWPLKKKLGPLAYVAAGYKALRETLPPIQVSIGEDKNKTSGEQVLVGNGRFYGGSYRVFPHADLCDGLLEVCVFPRFTCWTFFGNVPRLAMRGVLSKRSAQTFRGESVDLTSEAKVGLQVDGEWIGQLPATFTIRRNALRVIVP